MINKYLKEIKERFEYVEKYMQDNDYIDELDKGLERQNQLLQQKDREIKKLREENDFLKQLVADERHYSYGIRMGINQENIKEKTIL